MMSTDAESFSLSIRRFSGIKEIYEVAKETLFHMEITTASGNLRVVAVRDKKIVYEFDINGSCNVTLEKGTVLKICGESAELKIRIEKQ